MPETIACVKPSRVIIELNRRCNLRCVFCQSQLLPAWEMSPTMWETLAGQLGWFAPHTRFALHGFGEPLLGGLTRRAAREIRRRLPAALLEIYSNGQLLDRDWSEQICTEHLFDEIFISLESASAETYAAFRRGGTLARLRGNLEYLAACRQRHRVSWPEIKFAVVVCRNTLNHLPGVIALAETVGVRNIKLSPLVEFLLPGEADITGGSIAADDPALQAAVGTAEAAAAKAGIHLDWRPLFSGPPPVTWPGTAGEMTQWAAAWIDRGWRLLTGRYAPVSHTLRDGGIAELWQTRCCYEPYEMLSINAHGDVLPCCQATIPLGNLAEESLEEIWSGAPYRRLRASFLTGTLSGDCRSCAQPIASKWSYWRGVLARKGAAYAGLDRDDEHQGAMICGTASDEGLYERWATTPAQQLRCRTGWFRHSQRSERTGCYYRLMAPAAELLLPARGRRKLRIVVEPGHCGAATLSVSVDGILQRQVLLDQPRVYLLTMALPNISRDYLTVRLQVDRGWRTAAGEEAGPYIYAVVTE